jgi:2-polyprenyl-3-methyl-5-hydroxy-6-metoxy-1,4-benzoquinol methylase
MERSPIEHKLSDIKVSLIQKNITGSDILDVGSGYGYYSEWLAEKNPHLHIVAIDQLDLAGVKGADFMRANLEQPLPFEDNCFDTILAFDIIEHIMAESSLIKELYRICKPNGVLVGSVPHNNDGFLPAYNLTFYHRTDLTHKRYYTPESLQAALDQGNFVVKNIEAQGIVPPSIFAEFFIPCLRPVVKKIIGALRRIHLINAHTLSSDLFFVAHKRGERTNPSCTHQ